MKIPKQIMALSALAIATLVTACGGSSSSSAPASRDDVVSAGIITEFGSVFVNDRRYDTSGAQIKSADDDSLIDIINDDSNLALLKTYLGLGQVIVLRGSTAEDGSNGIANTIYIDNQLIGPVDTGSVNNTNATFTVLGQTVTVSPDTIIDDSIIEALITPTELSDDVRFADIEQTAGQSLTLSQLLTGGMVVEVSGFSSLDGVEATRIEDVNNRDRSNGSSSSSASGEVEVKGFVSNLTAGQFTINSLTVTYADSALDAEDFSGRALADGDFVEVKGTVASNILDASEIELEDSFPGGSSSSGASSSSSSGASSSSSSGASSSSSSGASSSSSSGASSSSSSGASSSSSSGASSSSSSGASSSSSSSRIEVEGIITEVRTGDSTIVIHGLVIPVQNVAQFSVGQRVKIKGRLQDDGGVELNLEGDDSGIEDSSVEDNVRIEDNILVINGSVITTDLGVVIDFSNGRARTDGSSPVVSNAVEARGFLLDGNVVWTRVEFDDEGTSECRLRGPVENITATTAFSIQGVTVDVSQVTSSSGSSSSSSSSTGFRDAADNAITREAFFDQLNVGDVVQAQSIELGCSDGALVADEVEFENSSNFSSSSSSSGASSSSSSGASSSSSSSGASSSSSSGASSSSSSSS